MNRIIIAVAFAILLIGGAVFFLRLTGAGAPRVEVSESLYDTDASGAADLTRRDIRDQARIWRWDREPDGQPEVIAYDAAVDETGALHPTGSVGAWDFGADGVIDEGTVPDPLRELLLSEELANAIATAGAGRVELVDMDTRAFVDQISERYDAWRLAGFRMPIVGASLPTADRLLPGAPRTYRGGVHQGFDMYEGYIGVPTAYGGPVIAAKDGTIVRADTEYVELTPEEYAAVIATSRAAGTTPADELDELRGRQIWIDHGHGVISRYCHLSGVAPGIEPGQPVEAATVIGFVGNSGMETGARGTRGGAHLHFELRVDGRYFGEGMSPDAIRVAAAPIFGLE